MKSSMINVEWSIMYAEIFKKAINLHILDKKVKKWFFYPYSVNLIDMDMGPPHSPVESWNPPPVKILSQNMKNWTNSGKKLILAIFAMSTMVADIPELVPD